MFIYMIMLMMESAVAQCNPAAGRATRPLERFEQRGIEMAVPVRIVVYAPDRKTAHRAVQAALGRIAELNEVMSDYSPTSELRRLCANSGPGKPVPVSDDLWNVLVRAQHFAELSGGAFDVTVGPVVRLWRRARRQHRLPSPERMAEAKPLVGYRLLKLDPKRHAVELLREGMRLDLGGIAKGYAVDEALKTLRRHGIGCALVDAGGDLAVGEAPPERPGWLIGIAALEPRGKPSRCLWLKTAAIATSGDMWQYVQIGGRRYSHIVDPRTGMALTDHSAVTVVAPDCTTADALASAVSVLGPAKGIELIDKFPGTAALVMRAPAGKVEVYQSRGWAELHEVDPTTLEEQMQRAEQ